MSAHQLDTAKLSAAIEVARRAGTDREVSRRAVARQAGVPPSTLTRLARGQRPDADGLCSLLLWLDPGARVADYVVRVQELAPAA